MKALDHREGHAPLPPRRQSRRGRTHPRGRRCAPARAAALLAAGTLLLLCAPAAAQLDDTELRLAPDLDVKVLHGYPVTRHAYSGPLVFGLELRNRGPERTVQLEVDHPTQLTRSLRVPARERTRAFFTLPTRVSYGSSALFELVDSRSGKRRRLSAGVEYQTEEPVARLGPISTAFNVEKPYSLIGALDGRVPDDARALTGIRMIVVEHGYAAAQVGDWKPLIEWVALGGLLVVSTPAERAAEPPPWGEQLPFARPLRATAAGSVQEVGYGAIARVLPERLAKLNADFLPELGVCEECRWSVAEREIDEDLPSKHAYTRLHGVVARPGWGLFGVLLLFSTAVGPVGWIWLVRRRGWPLRYLGFVLGTATLFSMAVLAHDLFENGIDAKCAARSLVLIDQRSGSELGLEDAAIYAPTERGTGLRVHPGALTMLPSASAGIEELKPRLRSEQGREWVEHAVPVRQRELVATRWLLPQRGGLEIDLRPDGLWVENQTGRELVSLVLWLEGDCYYAPDLARGGRARVRPLGRNEVGSTVPALAAGSVVGNGAPLAQAIIEGKLARNRYAAFYHWSPRDSGLIGDGVAPRAGKEHVLVGVF